MLRAGYEGFEGEIPDKYLWGKLRKTADPIVKANSFYNAYKLKTKRTQKIYDVLLENGFLKIPEDDEDIFYDQLEELKQGKGQ